MAPRFNRKPLTDTERDARRKANRERIEQAVRALLTLPLPVAQYHAAARRSAAGAVEPAYTRRPAGVGDDDAPSPTGALYEFHHFGPSA